VNLEWMDWASCREIGPEPFFPIPGEDPTPMLAVCHDCPVQIECREHADALEASGHWRVVGIWGGTIRKFHKPAA